MEEFLAAYDAVLGRWPVAVRRVDVESEFGVTRVQVCGPADGAPLVLLHGGGATSAAWLGNVAELSREHRVYAFDQLGGPGRSIHNGRPFRRPGDLLDWLDSLFRHFRLTGAGVCGHSYGGWLALSYALRAPARVGKLALLDPTQCFAGFRPGYLLRALPSLLRPSAKRERAFLEWELGGAPVDPEWLDLVSLGAEFPSTKVVAGRRPSSVALSMPVLLVLAGKSRAHDVRRVEANARAAVGSLEVLTLPEATHHSLPLWPAEPLNRALTAFYQA
ncbi:alpha/beta fold hydrolase [Amycolatopsis sp. 195334CR]|uniref:alpha/beta fold hydrolase n=1 Tax=Amycolatopsis sp. 195334CR TaxID=2814588 RepID=UPI001A90B958|nr:alpha/beta hydrolase [Amycolatopsis sp. 195334CR]MBN6033277.1 alpha/beta hydrolase [Amycolatopsis sp. 195334CR]